MVTTYWLQDSKSGDYHFLWKGVPNILGVIIFWKENTGHKIFDDQNVGSHKMTTDSVFNLFKKIDFNTILACLRCIGVGGHIMFVPKRGGS